MERTAINPTTLAEPVGYFSRAVRIGDTLHVSGTSAITGFTGDLNDRRIPGGIEEQTRLTRSTTPGRSWTPRAQEWRTSLKYS